MFARVTSTKEHLDGGETWEALTVEWIWHVGVQVETMFQMGLRRRAAPALTL